jgi:base plate protein
MCALSTSKLLSAWEQGLGQQPAERALTLLAVTDAESMRSSLAKLCIGRRDERLLSLRERLFGPELNCLADCPNCNERLEFTLLASELRQSGIDAPPESLSLTVDNWQIEFRLPNSEDLLEIADVRNAVAGRNLLIERCILSVVRNEQAEAVDQLAEQVVNAVVQKMSDSDPQADVQLSLSCPGCREQWQESFDIAGFLWSEVNAWARRIIREVDALARVYGWSEADILALTPLRRQIYLGMVSQ